MNTLVKSVVIVVGLFGLTGLSDYSLAKQKQKVVAVISGRPIMQVAEISDGDSEKNDDNLQGRQETIELKSLAKITPQQAQKLAETTRSGRASTVKLETEEKSLVYSVMIGSDEIMIDAGNGKVLCTNSQNNEKDEINCPRGSIQVSTIGDGDGETNDDKLK